MMTADVTSSSLNIGAVLILSPPSDAGERYLDELHRESLAGQDALDPRGFADIRTGAWRPPALGFGATPTRLT